MKKLLLTFLLLPALAIAQIPNPSFETWIPYTNGFLPQFWQTSDSISQAIGGGVHSAIQSADACHLLSSIQLTSTSLFGGAIKAPGLATTGILTASASALTIKGGTPTTTRYADFSGCYKYAPVSGDIALATAILFKWNGSTRDTLAIAALNVSAAAAVYTNFTVPFQYRSTTIPDTMLVIIQSSPGLNNAQPGSQFLVDNLDVSGVASGILQHSFINAIDVYPSPAMDQFKIAVDFNRMQAATYQLMDETGRVLVTDQLKATQTVNTSSMTNGIYLLMIRNEAGEKVYQTSITVMH